MPSSLLFGINNEGRVHTLSTTGSMWRELPYVGQEFKKLSAVPHFLWAIGGDHQVYVYVHGLDIPIRVREESYENERWIPIEGFSTRLLPTDRYHYSSADGTVDRSRDRIRLPSMAWQWEGDWQLELTLDGQPLDHHGWTYAVDFPSQYYTKKQWSSCVRRRCWVRSRRYSAMNSWCAIAPLHKDATSVSDEIEPFIDISVGGQQVAGADPGTMLVWAVTSHNRVMFRTGVSTKSPEGAKWTLISVPLGCEVNQLNVGSTGLVWAALLDGRALVRIGVTRESLAGDSWVEVRSPGENLRINQLSVGTNSVWAVTHDKQVWFRKGIKGEGAGVSEEMAAGCGWVEMVGKMNMVSVSVNDQVFAVGADDRAVYIRSGVSSGDPTGKRWRSLHAPLQISRASSNASLNKDRFHRSTASLHRPHSLCDNSSFSDIEEQSRSAPTVPTTFEAQFKTKSWCPVLSVGSVVGTEVHPESDESLWQERSDSSIFADDEELCWAEYEAPWSWVEAGACTVEPSQLPNWFAEGPNAQQGEREQPWRLKILEDLKSRLRLEEYNQYQLAIDTSSWKHSGEARVNLTGTAYIDCALQLEWMQSSGSFTILNPDGATSMMQFSVAEITCVQSCSEPGSPRLAIYVPNLTPSVVRLQFTGDTLLEEWQTQLTSVCSQVQSICGKPGDASIWTTTTSGDIFVWDSQTNNVTQTKDSYYTQEIDMSAKSIPIRIPFHTGCHPGTIITLTGCIADDADRVAINLNASSTFKARHKAHSEHSNCVIHINPRMEENCVVRNSMIEGKWGEEERHGVIPFKQGHEFTMTILCKENNFVIFINKEEFCTFRYRLPGASATEIEMWGKIQPFKLTIASPMPVIKPLDLYFRQIGGHLRKIESCRLGLTWGIAYDRTPWVYNGGWGGGSLGTLDSNNILPMTDSQDYRIYENNRWNPVTGYTNAFLPTDRHMWSDSTGKIKRTKDQVKLLSMHWQWVSDWMVDFHVPGGVDKEGWQYAVDFPSTFHANKQFTDYVRRRRWYRRCAVATTGPWQELGHTKLLDVSIEPISDEEDSVVSVWAIAAAGQAMFRYGVSKSNPMGTKWEHVSSDQALSSISCGPFNQVWATGKNGCAYFRLNVKDDEPMGDNWQSVEPPIGVQLKQISVGKAGIWAIGSNGRLHVRKEITSTFPEGTHWQTINVDPPILSTAPHTTSFRHVSIGASEVWATTDGGVLLRRLGICSENKAGSGWDIGIAGNWQHLSINALQ